MEICFFPPFGFDLFRIRQRVIFFNDFGVGIHLAWDNGRKHCFSNISFAFGESDFTFPDLELWQIGENWEAMDTRVEIVDEEIRKLNVAIEGLETLSKDTTDKDEKKDLRDEISQKTALMIAKQNTLTALITSQQGNFNHIFPLSLPQSSRCNPLPNLFRHLIFTHSGLANS